MELMVGLTIGVLIIGAVFVVYLSTSSTSKRANSVIRMTEDSAVAMAVMGNYLRMDGYSPPRVIVAPGAALVNGVLLTSPDRNFSGLAIRGCDFGFANVTVAFDSLACNTTAAPGKASVALRFEGDLNSTIPIGGNPSDCLANGITATTTSDLDSTPYKIVETRLFAATGASGTPELYCAGNGGGFAQKPLVQYVEGIFLTYGLAVDGAQRLVTRYVDQTTLDVLGGDVASRWNRVISVRVCLVMRSQHVQEDATGYSDCSGAFVATTDGYARRAFSTTFTLRNRGDFATL